MSREALQPAVARAIAQATAKVVWLLSADGQMLDDSPSWRELTGQSPAEAAGHGWLDAIHPDERADALAAWEVARDQRRGFEAEYRVRRPGGRFTRSRAHGVPVLGDDGDVALWVLCSTEVWADESMRRSEERLRLATQAARVAVWEYDFVAGQMARTDNHDALYGLAPQPVWTYDLFTGAAHPDDRTYADRTVQAAVAPGGDDSYAFDFRVVWPDGSVHWLAVSGRVVARSTAGQATLVRGALIDVTRLKQIEAELRAAVRVRDEFMHYASHELRTPLTPLMLTLDNLRHQLAAEPAVERADGGVGYDVLDTALERAQRYVGRLSRLVEDMLDATRLSHGGLELVRVPLSLAALARDVVDEHALIAERCGCELVLSVEGDASGSWDRVRLRQVLENLLENALEHGRGRPVHLEVAAATTRVRLAVRDEGPGIDATLLPRIFEKFERGTALSGHGGLGLGLFIASRIVAMHGGSIRAESPPGRGASIVVELPRQA